MVRTDVSPVLWSRWHVASSSGVPPWAIVLSRVSASSTGVPPDLLWLRTGDHSVSNVTGGDDMAGQAGGAVEDVDSQDM